MNQANNSFLEDFKTQLHRKKLQPESIRTYCADIQQYFEWLTECELASPLAATAQDAQEYVAFLNLPAHALRAGKTGSYSLSTIARKVKTLRYFYDFLNESEDK
jgi:site-specific recombinase XerD